MPGHLGFDSGGSGTAWALLAADGTLRARGDGPPVQLTELGAGAAAARLARIAGEIAAAHGAVDVVVAAVAGAGAPGPRAELHAALAAKLGAVRCAVTGDVAAAAAAALADAPGVAVQAGTGSFAVARDPDGRLHRVGGRGPLLSDEGSAHEIVREAARAVLRAADRLGPPTALTAPLVARFAPGEPLRLGVRLAALRAGEIAAALPDVVAAAAHQDEIALELLAAAGRRLAALVLAAAVAAGIPPATLRVRFGGGVLTHCVAVRGALAATLAGAGVRHPPDAAADPAELGAARLARALALGQRPLRDWVDA